MEPEEGLTSALRRITELELGYMALERLTHDLSDVVASQQRTLDALRAEITLLTDKAHALGEPAAPPALERPPHY